MATAKVKEAPDEEYVNLSFWAKMQFLLGKIGDALAGNTEAISGLRNFLANPIDSPVPKKLAASFTGTNSTYTFLDLGAPPAGKVWDVRRIAVWGTATDSFTAVSNAIAEVMTAIAVPANGSGAPAIEHLVTTATAANLPYANLWSRDEFTLVNREHLIVAIKSIGTAAIQVAAQVMEWDESQRRSWAVP